VSGSFAGELLTTTHLADPQEWRTRAIAAGEATDDAVVAAARAVIAARASDEFTPFDGNLDGVDGLPDLLTSDEAIAPTRLEAYATCPHAYFVQRLLRVEPLEQPEDLLTISALDIGNFLHESLDELAKEGDLPEVGAPWTTAQRERLQHIALAKAEGFEERGVTGHPRLWAVEREQLLHDLVRILDDDDTVRALRGATVLASELAFGTGDEPPVEIPVPGGRVLMKGSADRVDESVDGTLVVIDLKTGSESSYKDIEKAGDRLVGGTKLQLPVYAHAARRQYGAKDVRAEYWFVRRGMKRIELPLEAVEAQYAETVGLLARSIRDGVFPARPPETPDFLWVRCPYCNPDGIGHGEARERWERKRRDTSLAEYVGLVEPAALEAGDDE
jgi:RecB family exonuclease